MFSQRAFKTVMVTLLAWFLLFNGAANAGQGGQDSAQLHQEFEQARQAFSGFKVESPEAFQRIADYHSNVVNDAAVVHRFETHDGSVILCVDIYSQESVRAAGIDPSEITLSPVIPPKGGKASSAKALKPTLPGSQWLDGSVDQFGQQRMCPDNTFPKLAPSLEDLYRYRSLEAYFNKYPSGGKPAGDAIKDAEAQDQRAYAVAAAPLHRWAIAERDGGNIGGGADFSLWSPFVEVPGEFSLSQLWITAGSGASFQTVEYGWQKLPSKYGDQKAHLFIY